ncbi:MAG: class I SAM-dependent methyltransferase [Burkholderiales bacterium]|nr:class I SAM-dependent methyltransferase [Burkholderiales bacterium]
MDALTRMLERLQTQRACLDHAATLIGARPGAVLEVGLGKGRTYDRLRSLFPQRAIYAFDREVHCAPQLRPDEARLFLGDFRASLPAALERLGRCAVLAHVDLGTEDFARDCALAAEVAPLLARLLLPEALVLCDRPMAGPGWTASPHPAVQAAFAYYLYRTAASGG